MLKERKQLDAFIPRLPAQLRVGLNLLNAVQQEEEALKFHKKGFVENKNFTCSCNRTDNQKGESACWYSHNNLQEVQFYLS